jgi:hypothetical protein
VRIVFTFAGAWALIGVVGAASPPHVDAAAVVRLSNETTLSHWAYPEYPARARAAPGIGARTITRLRYFTENRQLELYLALEMRTDESGVTWVKVRLPMRPNGRIGWVPRAALGRLHRVQTHLVINRRTLRAALFRRGRRIWRAPIGVGRPTLPTPGGRFYIRERLRSLNPFYGPVAFGTSAYSAYLSDWPGGGVVGIHGTSLPALVPGRPSHGCVRLRNRDILRLARLMPKGTPVRIL